MKIQTINTRDNFLFNVLCGALNLIFTEID